MLKVNKPTVRMATPADAAAIQEIYSYYVENTAITFEYAVPTVSEMEKRIKNTLLKFPYLVAEENGAILGYCYAGPYHERAAYQWNAELSIYLDREVRGNGLGKLLYVTMEERMKELGYLNLYACIAHAVKEDDHLHNDSEAFHKKMGFRTVARSHKCGYKFGTWYDMVWMEKMIGRHTVPPRDIRKNSETGFLQ